MPTPKGPFLFYSAAASLSLPLMILSIHGGGNDLKSHSPHDQHFLTYSTDSQTRYRHFTSLHGTVASLPPLSCCCSYASEAWTAASMETPEALPRPHKLSHHFLSPPLPCFDRFLSPSVYAHLQYDNVLKQALCIGNQSFHMRSPVMSLRNEKSLATSKDYCEVWWTVEAELTDGQVLYLSSDTADLGCWDPEMAIPMSPAPYPNLWKARVKVASGMNFRYNYFKREGVRPSEVIWRPGPEFSLLVPQPNEENRKIVVRDSWLTSGAKSESSASHGWGSWIEETYPSTIPLQELLPRDEDDSVESRESGKDLLKVEPFFSGHDDIFSEDKISLIHNSDIIFCERDQPVEEPWLVQTLLSPSLKDIEIFNSIHHEHEENEVTHSDSCDQHHQAADKLLKAEGKYLVSTEDSISTVILINSSICTMQRIAVLEDGTLVELLLQPVKSNVQCDSVYVGVLTKLVPNMGGAFVNIGNSRHSLMDIKRNREPFLFPPFSIGKMKQETDCSISEAVEGQSAAHRDENTTDSSSECFSEDIPGKYGHDEYEENEDDDFDVLEILKGSLNGSSINFGEVTKDDSSKSKNHQGGESLNHSSLSEIEFINSAKMSCLEAVKTPSAETSGGEHCWNKVRRGTKIIVQVVKEGLGSKGPTLTPYPKLRSRFWILLTRCDKIGVSKKISGMERTRLKVIAKALQPQGFGLTVRTVAAGHSLEELQKDLEGLLTTWKNIVEHAKSAALAADEGVEGAVPVILHRAMGQTLSVVQDYFNEKVKKMVVDSPRTLHEVTNYLQEIAPDLCDRVELYNQRNPLFDEFNIEAEIDNILSKRVPLANGGSLVIEQTEALVSIDVNGGHGMFGQGNSQEQAILDVNLAAAKQIARELRVRDIGGIIVVDFIDMADESNKRLVYEEVKKAVERDRSTVKVSELSKHGLMEITRKRVRPSVTFMISEPCSCCHATGRVEALETSFSKIEQEICLSLANMDNKANPEDPKSWPRFILRVDHHMCEYLTSGKKTRIAILSSSLKVWIILKVARGFTRGEFEVKLFSNDDKMAKNQPQVSSIPILRPSSDGRAKGSGKKLTLFPVKKFKKAA